MCWYTKFYSVFEHQPDLGKNGPKKAIAFHILQNTSKKQKKVLLQPPSWPQIGVFLNERTLMLNKNIT